MTNFVVLCYNVYKVFTLNKKKERFFDMRIKELRKKMGISQTELGIILGVTRSTICLYEQGKRQPDNTTLVKLADFFGVTVDYLLGRDCGEQKPNEPIALSKEEKKLIHLITQLTDEETETLSKFVDFIISQRE